MIGAGPASLHLLVPATPPKQQLTWTAGAAHAVAEQRLAAARGLFGQLPADLSGEVGDPSPLLAIRDVLERGRKVDLIVVSTLPAGWSRWLRYDLPRRVERTIGLPVRSVIAPRPVAGDIRVAAPASLRS
jgi:hypothetical protein